MDRLPGRTRPLRWTAFSYKDFIAFPLEVKHSFGFEFFLMQSGQYPVSAKQMRGLGSGTIELIDDFDGDTYRAVVTVQFPMAVYVLHAFKKKSKRGIRTTQSDIELIRRRLRDAELHHQTVLKQESKDG